MFDKRKNVIASVATIGSIPASSSSRRRGSIHFIFALVLLFLLTACTSYYEEFEDEYGYGKSSKGYKIDGTTLTDLRDEHTYNVAKVGNLYWMLDNVAYKFYRNHDEEDKADCPRPSERTCVETGFLYPGTKLDYVCPNGWRLPSYEEWEEFYNSSAFRNYSLDNDVYKGYMSGDRSLNKDGEAAYFWTNDEADGSHYRKCLSITPESGSFQIAGPCHEQWKLAVRCVKEVNGGSSQSGDSGNDEPVDYHHLLDQYNCSVSDGVKVLYPEGGESFKVGETIPVIYGSDVKGSGFRFVFKTSEDDAGVDLLEESAGEENPNGQSCYVQEVTLSADLVGVASTGIIRVVPYENSSKGANSGAFKISNNGSSSPSSDSENEGRTVKLDDSRDGQEYKAVIIGGRAWMVENLRYEAEGSYCFKDDESCDEYGHFYTWDVAKKSCPEGWHLPSQNEWSGFFSTDWGKDLAKEMKGWSCALSDKYMPAANIMVSIKPTSYQEESCGTLKECSQLFVRVVNNDDVDYENVALRLYLGAEPYGDAPVSNIMQVFSASGEVSPISISFDTAVEDDSGEYFLPVIIHGTLPASGKIYFQVKWRTLDAFRFGWSIIAHPYSDYIEPFDGVELEQAQYFKGSETVEVEKNSKGEEVQSYTEDPYVPVYVNGELVSGFAPDGSTESQLLVTQCSEVNTEASSYWTSDEDGPEMAYFMVWTNQKSNEDYYYDTKGGRALSVRCVKD